LLQETPANLKVTQLPLLMTVNLPPEAAFADPNTGIHQHRHSSTPAFISQT